MFRGHIECIDSDDDNGGLLCTVVYEDDDREDLGPQDCVPRLRLWDVPIVL